MLALSWTAAVVACLGYGVVSVLQSVAARRTATAVALGGLAAVVGQLPYVAGLAADGVAYVANVVALRQLPLFLVQAVVTASVGVTAVVARFRGERLRRSDWLALGVLGLGLVLLGLTAAPERAVPVARGLQWPPLPGSPGPAWPPPPAGSGPSRSVGACWPHRCSGPSWCGVCWARPGSPWPCNGAR